MNDEFDGSALRELLEPAVADGRTLMPPADAIVASGRRRARGRRISVAGGAIAIVAAVPLAASAIAAGPGGGTSAASGGAPGAAPTTHVTSPHTAGGAPAPGTTVTTDPNATVPSGRRDGTPPPSGTLPLGPLPTTPKLLAEGTLAGKKWTVSGVASGGNNELTKNSQCLKLLITDGGRTRTGSLGDVLLYCSGYPPNTYLLSELMYDVPGGAGNLAIGTGPATAVKVVAHVQGVADPVSVPAVPAPGADRTIYVVPAGTTISPRIDLEFYDAQGHDVGAWDNHSNPPRPFPGQTGS